MAHDMAFTAAVKAAETAGSSIGVRLSYQLCNILWGPNENIQAGNTGGSISLLQNARYLPKALMSMPAKDVFHLVGPWFAICLQYCLTPG
eukprot:10880315-Karenia_brevis.AAC.1